MSEKVLETILQEMKRLADSQERTEQRIENIETDLNVIKSGQQGIRTEITDRFNEVKQEVQYLSNDVELTFVETSGNNSRNIIGTVPINSYFPSQT